MLARVAVAILAVTLLGSAKHVGAVGGQTWGGSNQTNGLVLSGASTNPTVVEGGRSLCRWSWLTKGQVVGLAPSQGTGMPADEAAAGAVVTQDAIEYRVYLVQCPDGDEFRLVDPNRPPNLRDPITDLAEDTIELPVPDLSPPVDGSGYVNLGMWLAVTPASYGPITASAGPFWMTVTPTIGTTVFDFGNGDTATCDGFGVPIVDLETVEEGPCGYTYREPGTYAVTATTRWDLPFDSSGGSGSLPAMPRTSSFEYTVREIQTVGVGN